MSSPELTTPMITNMRHRITFGTDKTLAYVSVLELGKIWERSIRRAGIPLLYSQGYNPRPRMAFAAPLPVGCGSEADLLDFRLEEPRTPEALLEALTDKLPRDLHLIKIEAVPEGEDALNEQLSETEYRIQLFDATLDDIQARIDRFLALEELRLPRRGRKYRGKTYDLRPLVHTLTAEANNKGVAIFLRVNARPGATGRPDEMLKALDLTDVPRRMTRSGMVLGHVKPEPVVEDADNEEPGEPGAKAPG